MRDPTLFQTAKHLLWNVPEMSRNAVEMAQVVRRLSENSADQLAEINRALSTLLELVREVRDFDRDKMKDIKNVVELLGAKKDRIQEAAGAMASMLKDKLDFDGDGKIF